jgi:hypothetical protein
LPIDVNPTIFKERQQGVSNCGDVWQLGQTSRRDTRVVALKNFGKQLPDHS